MAKIVLTHPDTGHAHEMHYEVLETITDHLGQQVEITDWHVLNPKTLEQMGVSKPLEIAEYLYDLTDFYNSTVVREFSNSAIYFITDGCFSNMTGHSKKVALEYVKVYMDRYTTFRASYHLWTRLWSSVLDVSDTGQAGYSGILGRTSTEEDSPRYELERGVTRVQRLPVSGENPTFTPSCGDEWLGRRNYSYKMDKGTHKFFRHLDREFYEAAYPRIGVPMFGLELEVSTSLHTDELQYIVCDVEPKQEPFFIMKEDSSITGSHRNKFEIVTVPASPRYLKKAFSTLFDKIEKLCVSSGKSMSDIFDLSTDLGNGIHIHIDRRSFHNNKKKTHIARFLSAFNLGDSETAALFSQISRRPGDYRTATYCSIDHYLTRYKTGYKLKEAQSTGHRGATSMRQHATVEVRIFQGIVDINHIRSCIEATQAMLDYTHMMPLSTLNRKFASGFKNFVLKSGEYNTLRKELK